MLLTGCAQAVRKIMQDDTDISAEDKQLLGRIEAEVRWHSQRYLCLWTV